MTKFRYLGAYSLYPLVSATRAAVSDLDTLDLAAVRPEHVDRLFLAGQISLELAVDFYLARLYLDPTSEAFSKTQLRPISGVGCTFSLAFRYCSAGRDAGLELPPRIELRNALLACRDGTTTIHKPEETVTKGTTPSSPGEIPSRMLEVPPIHQLLLATALTLWNKSLVKAIVSEFPPTPHTNALFGRWDGADPEKEMAMGPQFFIYTLLFGPPGPAPLGADNGSGLLSAFVKAGWTYPYPCYLLHACKIPNEEDGLALTESLAEPLRQ